MPSSVCQGMMPITCAPGHACAQHGKNFRRVLVVPETLPTNSSDLHAELPQAHFKSFSRAHSYQLLDFYFVSLSLLCSHGDVNGLGGKADPGPFPETMSFSV